MASQNRLCQRGLKPVAELAASRDHGDRLRYMAGCRCDLCRKANSRYECERKKARKAGDWNGVVSADAARAHMLKLSRQGVGRRAVGAATDIGDTILQEIRSGARKNIRARTERLILAVTPAVASDHALLPAGRTQARLRNLLEEGYTEAFLAKRRGLKTPRLQIGKKRVLVCTANKIQRLHRELTQ